MNLENLSERMEKLFNDILIEEKKKSLGSLRENLLYKKNIIDEFIFIIKSLKCGNISMNLVKNLVQISAEFKDQYENFDDKFMIFIIGNGNVGKSTLLNALIGVEVAKMNNLPTTWKIDVYSPSLNKNEGIIKYVDGNKEKLSIDKLKQKAEDEEKKSKEQKKEFNKKKNDRIKELVNSGEKLTKEKRKELEEEYEEKYLYKPTISEIRWPIEKKLLLQENLLENCLLVDTPGFNQNLYYKKQLADVHNYYHKADGVLWLLDGLTISAANAKQLNDILDENLRLVQGDNTNKATKNNIIGVINKMDLVKENGGEKSIIEVHNQANKIFGKKFAKIVDISSYKALNGKKRKDDSLIKESGILILQDAIRDIFISKSDKIKSEAKERANNTLLKETFEILDYFENKVKQYKELYIEKYKKLKDLKENLSIELNEDINNFFESYLNEVNRRVNIHIDALSEGKGSEFVKETIYKLDEFLYNRDNFIKNKDLELKNNFISWKKISKIEQYKYIKSNSIMENTTLAVNTNVNLASLNNIEYFTPSIDGGLLSFLGNILGKAMFWLSKGSIKNKLNKLIREECNNMKTCLNEQLEDIIKREFCECEDILNKSFEELLFKFSNLEDIEKNIEKLKINLNRYEEKTELKKIIL